VAELYPNPFRESLTLILTLGKEDLYAAIHVTIADMSGKQLYTVQLSDLKEGRNMIVLHPEGDIPGLTSGVYIVRINSGKRILSRMRAVYLGK
jgi:hypothetical protein